MISKLKSRLTLPCVLVCLSITSCATRPVPSICPPPQKYPYLKLPEQGFFRSHGHQILSPSTPAPNSTPSSTPPTTTSHGAGN